PDRPAGLRVRSAARTAALPGREARRGGGGDPRPARGRARPRGPAGPHPRASRRVEGEPGEDARRGARRGGDAPAPGGDGALGARRGQLRSQRRYLGHRLGRMAAQLLAEHDVDALLAQALVEEPLELGDLALRRVEPPDRELAGAGLRSDELLLRLRDHADEPSLEATPAEILGGGGQHGAFHGGEPALHGGKADEGSVHAAPLLGAGVHGADVAIVACGRTRGAEVIGTADLGAVAEVRVAAVRVTLAGRPGAEEDEGRARILSARIVLRRAHDDQGPRAGDRRAEAVGAAWPGVLEVPEDAARGRVVEERRSAVHRGEVVVGGPHEDVATHHREVAPEALAPGARGLGKIPDDGAVLLVEDEDLTRVARAGGVAQRSSQHEAIARDGERGAEVVPGARIRV